jgi:hypothetical protein
MKNKYLLLTFAQIMHQFLIVMHSQVLILKKDIAF